MADTLNLEVGATATVPLAYVSKYGVAATVAPGVEVSTDSPTVAVAALMADGVTFEVAGLAAGSAVLSVVLGGVTVQYPVEVGQPVASHAEAVIAAATFRATAK